MNINMTKLASVANDYMADQCEIYTLIQGAVDSDTFKTKSKKNIVYTGPVMIWQEGPSAPLAIGIIKEAKFQAGIPLSETNVIPDMKFRVLSSNDAMSVDQVFTISAVVTGTFAAFRWLSLIQLGSDL